MTIRKKIINGNEYYYEQKSVRVGNKVKTEHVRYIGKINNVVPNKQTQNKNNFVFDDDKIRKHFGYTDNPNEAGYILSDGKMLDFSGRANATGYKDRKPISKNGDYLANNRVVDHREIYQFTINNKAYRNEIEKEKKRKITINTPEDEIAQNLDVISIYGKERGSIRLNTSKKTYSNYESETIFLDIQKKPTDKQFDTIRKIKDKQGIYIVDYTDDKNKMISFEAKNINELKAKITENS